MFPKEVLRCVPKTSDEEETAGEKKKDRQIWEEFKLRARRYNATELHVTIILRNLQDHYHQWKSLDLGTQNDFFLNGGNPNDFEISYHLTEADAANNSNPLPLLYENSTNPQIIFVRRFEISTGNLDIAQLTLEVVPPPVIPEDFSITECDGDGDGFATFDLTSVEADIMALNSNIEISFLDPSNNPIVNPQDYTETSGFVSVEIIDVTNGCITIAILDLNVDSSC